jgi:cardiolipin synthase
MLQRIWTISTFLSFSRIILIVPLAYLLYADIPNNRVWVAAVLTLAAATDFLDGYFARKLHQVTDFGKIIDPVADKITVGIVGVLFVAVGYVPLWYVVIVIARDLLILIGGLYIKTKKNIVTQSNWPGKIAVSLIALYLLLSVVQSQTLEPLRHVVLWTSLGMMVFSLVKYVQRLFIGSSVTKRAAL